MTATYIAWFSICTSAVALSIAIRNTYVCKAQKEIIKELVNMLGMTIDTLQSMNKIDETTIKILKEMDNGNKKKQ